MTVLCRILPAVFALFVASAAQAQNYPDRPIRLIAPFPAGGLADVLARAVGDEMSKTLGQPVIVENRAGGSSNLGMEAVVRAAPDGYTLLFSPGAPLVINKNLFAKLSYDPDALVPISMIATNPIVSFPNLGVLTQAQRLPIVIGREQAVVTQ